MLAVTPYPTDLTPCESPSSLAGLKIRMFQQRQHISPQIYSNEAKEAIDRI